MQNNFLQQLMQALQGGGQPMLPQVAQTNQQTQQQAPQGFDPNQLFQSLIAGAIQQMKSGNKVDYSKYNIPLDTPGTLMHEGSHPIMSQATSQALMSGADPGLLDQARQWLGQNAYVGLCEAFVERMTQGAEGIYRSAIDAWNQHSGARQTGLSGIQPGDAVYFGADASNGGNGHTGVYMGNGQFISATDNGVRQYNLQDWQNATGQKLLGYVPKDQRVQAPRSQLYPQQPQLPQPRQIPSVSGGSTVASLPTKPPQQPVKPLQAPQIAPQAPKMGVPRAPIHAQNNPLAGIVGMFGRKA